MGLLVGRRVITDSPAPPWKAGLLCRCPACGKGGLYHGVLEVRDACTVCGFALKDHDHGDGAPYFVIIFFSTLTMALALWLELTYAPPVWLHLVLWIPLILLGSIGGLRMVKALLIAMEYRHNIHGFRKPDEPR